MSKSCSRNYTHGEVAEGIFFCPVGGGCFVDNVSEGWGISLSNPVRWVGVILSSGPRRIWSIVGAGVKKNTYVSWGWRCVVYRTVLRVGRLWFHMCSGGWKVWKQKCAPPQDNFWNSPNYLAAGKACQERTALNNDRLHGYWNNCNRTDQFTKLHTYSHFFCHSSVTMLQPINLWYMFHVAAC